MYLLDFHYYGITESTFINSILNSKHIRIKIPENHGLDQTWYLCLYLSDGSKYVLDSMTTGVGGWDEVGSLRVTKQEEVANISYTEVDIASFETNSVQRIIYSTESVRAEVGLRLVDEVGKSILICAGVSAGSLTLSIPKNQKQYNPENDESDYTFESIM